MVGTVLIVFLNIVVELPYPVMEGYWCLSLASETFSLFRSFTSLGKEFTGLDKEFISLSEELTSLDKEFTTFIFFKYKIHLLSQVIHKFR